MIIWIKVITSNDNHNVTFHSFDSSKHFLIQLDFFLLRIVMPNDKSYNFLSLHSCLKILLDIHLVFIKPIIYYILHAELIWIIIGSNEVPLKFYSEYYYICVCIYFKFVSFAENVVSKYFLEYGIAYSVTQPKKLCSLVLFFFSKDHSNIQVSSLRL